jgi:hypothetical protein
MAPHLAPAGSSDYHWTSAPNRALLCVELTPEVRRKLIDGLHAEVGPRSIAEQEAQRDEILLGLLELRSKYESPRDGPSEQGRYSSFAGGVPVGLVAHLPED